MNNQIVQHSSINPTFDDRSDENKVARKIKSKEKIYTIKTVIDRNLGTDWVNSRVKKNLIPSQDLIESHIAMILKNCNLNTITLRKLYGILSICFNVNLLNITIRNIHQVIKRILVELRRLDALDFKKIREKKVQ
ncbi:swib domain-containing protein [Cryptosporidium felis]|nr:swib domain-containing protein [Cryptosporidium felis]